MPNAYRANLLKMMRPDCTFIDSDIQEMEYQIEQLLMSQFRKVKLYLYVLFTFLSLIIAVLLSNRLSAPFNIDEVVVGLIAFVVLVLTSAAFIHSDLSCSLNDKLTSLSVFDEYRANIDKLVNKINRITEPAINYQRLMEPDNLPGLIAVFGDIIQRNHFIVPIDFETRKKYIQMSYQGNGRQINVREYGIMLQSLKLFNIDLYIKEHTQTSIDLIEADARSTIVMQCAYLITIATVKNKKLSFSLREKFIVLGLNASHATETFGRPEQWSPSVHALYDQALTVLKSAFNNNSDYSAEANSFYQSISNIGQKEPKMLALIRKPFQRNKNETSESQKIDQKVKRPNSRQVLQKIG